MVSEPDNRRRNWLTCLGLLVIVSILYGRGLGYEFLHWDDVGFVTTNSNLLKPNWASLLSFFFPESVHSEDLYIPVTYSTYWLENLVFGMSSGVMHATNLLLHALNTILVFWLLLRISRSYRVSLIGALLFAAHPLQVEVVGWVMGRKDLLATAFALGALNVWCSSLSTRCSDREDSIGDGEMEPEGNQLIHCSLVIALSILAFLSKPTIIVLPGLLLAVGVFLKGKAFKEQRLHIGSAAILLVVGVALLTLSRSARAESLYALPMVQRFLLWPWSVLSGISRLLMLESPKTFYPWPDAGHVVLPIILGWLGGGVVAALIVWAYLKKQNIVVLGLVFAAIAWAPTVGIAVKWRHFMTADRYSYFPLIGIFLVFGWLTDKVVEKYGRLAWGVIACVCCLLVFNQQRRHWEWENDRTLWEAQVANLPNDALGYMQLGQAMELADAPLKAGYFYQKGIETGTCTERGYYYYGVFLTRQGKLSDAAKCYKEALRLSPGYVEVILCLAGVLVEQGNTDEGIAAYRQGLRYDSPLRSELYTNLAIALARKGDLRAALDEVRKALASRPDNARAGKLQAHLQQALEKSE